MCRKCEGATIGITTPPVASPEAIGPGQTLPLRVPQVTWTSPLTNRLLLDAGFGGTYYGWGNFERDPNPTRDLIRVTEQCAAGCANNGGRANLVYRSQDWGDNRTGSYTWRGSAAYVTGTHSFKVGYQGTLMTDDRTWYSNNQNMYYRFNNGIPNQLTQVISPWVNDARAGWDAIFAQEQWTMGRLTLQGALRFDVARSWFPAQKIGPTRFLPVAYDFPETKGVDSYKDITPRMGVAWDVFGNGRTAVKMNFGRYLEGVGVQLTYANSNPTLRVPTSTGPFGVQGVSRTWIDADADLVPDCDFSNPLAHGNRRGGQRRRRARLLRTAVEHPVRTAGADRQLRPGPAQRDGGACGGLELRPLRAAAAHGPDVGGGRVLPAVVQRIHAQRQPGAGRTAT